jgi:hypothetical protein
VILTLSFCLRLSRAAACFSFFSFVVSTVSVSLCLRPSRDQRCGSDQKQKKRFLAEIESPGLQAAPPRDRSRACGRHKAAP